MIQMKYWTRIKSTQLNGWFYHDGLFQVSGETKEIYVIAIYKATVRQGCDPFATSPPSW